MSVFLSCVFISCAFWSRSQSWRLSIQHMFGTVTSAFIWICCMNPPSSLGVIDRATDLKKRRTSRRGLSSRTMPGGISQRTTHIFRNWKVGTHFLSYKTLIFAPFVLVYQLSRKLKKKRHQRMRRHRREGTRPPVVQRASKPPLLNLAAIPTHVHNLEPMHSDVVSVSFALLFLCLCSLPSTDDVYKRID